MRFAPLQQQQHTLTGPFPPAGLGDIRLPMLINVVGFWLVGMPVSLLLAFHLELGPVGLWWGLAVGLGAVGGLLLTRVAIRIRGEMPRMVVD